MSWIPDQVVSATKADPLVDTRAAAATPLARVGTPPLLTLNQFTATDADHVIMKYCELMVLAKKLYGKLMKIICATTGIVAVKLPDAMGSDVVYELFEV